MAFLGTLPAFRDPVGELVTQVLEAPVPEERPRLCQVLSGHHLDLIPSAYLLEECDPERLALSPSHGVTGGHQRPT